MLLLLVIGFGVLHNKDYNKYIFYVYFLFPQLLHKLQQTKQSFRLLVTTEESQENLSWVRDSTLQGHEKKMRTRKKQKIGGLFKWMRLVEFLTHQGLSAFQQTGHFTTLMTCKRPFSCHTLGCG